MKCAVAFVLHMSVRANGFDGVTGFQTVEVLRHLAAIWELRVHSTEINFDDEVNIAQLRSQE